ncbi:MAG: ABC transporter ATP-binding protein, partial [Verrucomicrobia bacterium]|nr:ABC transporter ATP-binding protein [Verrucomicrobiota bacterium]
RVRDAAALLGLEGCLDRRPAALSGGERQRVAIGRALVRQPAVFLFDEPLSNLDTPRRLQMREEILRLHDRLGATMVYVTHDQGDAQAMGNRLVVLNQGVIQQTAAPLALYHQPANLFVAGFIGSPPMNVFRGTISAKEGSLWLRSEAAAKDGTPAIFLQVPQELTKPLERFAGKAVFCGIRAEQVECVPKTVPAGQGGMGIVERTEPAGADTCLRLRLGEKGRDQIMARVPVNSRWEREEAVFFRFDPRQACFFDPATGDNLLPPE